MLIWTHMPLGSVMRGSSSSSSGENAYYEVGLQAGIFPIPGALYYPHLGDGAVERQMLEDTELVITGTGQHKKGPEHRYEVYAHIIRITEATKRLTGVGQLPSDLNRRKGLEAAGDLSWT